MIEETEALTGREIERVYVDKGCRGRDSPVLNAQTGFLTADEILSRKTVAERLDGWLVYQGSKLPSKGQWKSIAVQIGVSPEALYRELAKRRSE